MIACWAGNARKSATPGGRGEQNGGAVLFLHSKSRLRRRKGVSLRACARLLAVLVVPVAAGLRASRTVALGLLGLRLHPVPSVDLTLHRHAGLLVLGLAHLEQGVVPGALLLVALAQLAELLGALAGDLVQIRPVARGDGLRLHRPGLADAPGQGLALGLVPCAEG
jgi:hypothetical protein